MIAYPIPINCGNYIGEHIFYILNGFAEHSKTSAIHMSSLFHSFILCQVNRINLKTLFSLTISWFVLLNKTALDHVQWTNSFDIRYREWLECAQLDYGVLEQDHSWYLTTPLTDQSGEYAVLKKKNRPLSLSFSFSLHSILVSRLLFNLSLFGSTSNRHYLKK